MILLHQPVALSLVDDRLERESHRQRTVVARVAHGGGLVAVVVPHDGEPTPDRTQRVGSLDGIEVAARLGV